MSDKFKLIKVPMGEIEAMDIPTMHALTDEEYREYVHKIGLMYVDHHEVLRSSATGMPFATTLEQLDILMEEMSLLRGKMCGRDEKD